MIFIKNILILQRNKKEKMKIIISENISCENNNDYIKILNDSRSFLIIQSMILKEKKLKNFQIIVMLFSFGFFYTIIKQKHLEKNFQKKIKNIYSEVKIVTEIDTNYFSFEESMFYKTKKTKEYIKNLIDFLTEKYKEIKLNKKYYSICKQEETFKNCNLMMNQLDMILILFENYLLIQSYHLYKKFI